MVVLAEADSGDMRQAVQGAAGPVPVAVVQPGAEGFAALL
jgi:hypothetical protein